MDVFGCFLDVLWMIYGCFLDVFGYFWSFDYSTLDLMWVLT